MLVFVKYIHLLTLVIWVGSIVFFSFIGAPAIFKNFDKKTAGDIVGVIFPKYFMLGQVCSVLALITLVVIGMKTGFQSSVKVGLALLLIMAGVVAYSSMVNAPKAHEVKYQIRSEQDETKKAELRKQFGKLHGVSMILNLTTLILGLVLLFYFIRYVTLS
ncbi:hypothetical protein MNBD_NITROSPINAE04-787 [hydrothermal vent metagenome]|uniref:TMEM205-like domain-containing protein n=1 Tax=hydrothermal vent metagenome TaxID=652676 RepID=A0A3B1CGG1_9ZZZZ